MLKSFKLGAVSLTALIGQGALTAAAEVTYDERGLVYEGGAVTVQARGSRGSISAAAAGRANR